MLAKFVAPRLEQVFRARREAIEGGIERAEAMQAEAKAALEQYRRSWPRPAPRPRRSATRPAPRASRSSRSCATQAQEESARIVARGEEQLASQRQQVVNELRGQIGTLAVDLAGRVVGESLADEARRRGTVDRFLAELDDMAAGRGESAR